MVPSLGKGLDRVTALTAPLRASSVDKSQARPMEEEADMETMERRGNVLLRDGRDSAYFIPSEMRLFSLNADPLIPLEELFQLASQKHPSSGSPLSEGYAMEEREALLPILQEPVSSPRRARLGRLTLIISNVCNLSCSYCYVGDRNPSSGQDRMSPDTVREILRKLIRLYPEIEVVHFFGGEPLMNLPAIETATEFLATAVDQGYLEHMPRFAVTTNGTWSNPQVLDLLKRWNMTVTVSWDGTRDIQDSCRPLRSGASSYELLGNTLERFKNAGIEFDIECTYNGRHRKLGISITELMNFFYEKTGQRIIHLAPVFLPKPGNDEISRDPDYIDFETLAEDYREAARLSIANLLRNEGPVLEFAQRVVEHLATRIPAKTYCPAFFTQLSIGMDGAVYPCFMLVGHKEYLMGNLLQDSFPGASSKRVLERYFEEFTGWNAAWYSCLSEGCIAGEYLVTGNLRERVMAPMQRAIAEECVLGLARQLGAAQQVQSGNATEGRETASVVTVKEK